MTTDRQLLEDAARAAGHTLRKAMEYEDGSSWYGIIASGDEYSEDFDPLNDDGDALRLAVKLRINIEHMADMGGRDFGINCWPRGKGDCGCSEEDDLSDYEAATRRAIVRAAAAIGRQKEAE